MSINPDKVAARQLALLQITAYSSNDLVDLAALRELRARLLYRGYQESDLGYLFWRQGWGQSRVTPSFFRHQLIDYSGTVVGCSESAVEILAIIQNKFEKIITEQHIPDDKLTDEDQEFLGQLGSGWDNGGSYQ